jgi:hypothetical protein
VWFFRLAPIGLESVPNKAADHYATPREEVTADVADAIVS